MPDWLDSLCRAMDKRENFVGGVSRMTEISHKSLERLCRSCRRYLSSTPSEPVNARRLNYAANLPAHSDAKVSWIAHQSGFANLSHFYTRFTRAYKTTPALFRQMRKEGRGRAD
jgi:AraC family cel operon transcriptional repressor